jgi:hypothetical protein
VTARGGTTMAWPPILFEGVSNMTQMILDMRIALAEPVKRAPAIALRRFVGLAIAGG